MALTRPRIWPRHGSGSSAGPRVKARPAAGTGGCSPTKTVEQPTGIWAPAWRQETGALQIARGVSRAAELPPATASGSPTNVADENSAPHSIAARALRRPGPPSSSYGFAAGPQAQRPSAPEPAARAGAAHPALPCRRRISL